MLFSSNQSWVLSWIHMVMMKIYLDACAHFYMFFGLFYQNDKENQISFSNLDFSELKIKWESNNATPLSE